MVPRLRLEWSKEMNERCEPPPELRDRDGEHHLFYYPAGTDVSGNPVVVRWGARAQGWWADHLELRGHSPTETASMGWRYLAPVTPPATVAALVEALGAFSVAIPAVLDAADIDASDTVFTVRAVSPTGSRELAQRSLADMLEAARAAVALYRGEAW
jgi:hypothetical protein